jgi:hypothetical protein
MFHNRAFSIASKNDIDNSDLLLATVLTIWLKQIIRNQFVIEKINTCLLVCQNNKRLLKG